MNKVEIADIRRALRSAMDRQRRADTSEDWLADQNVIDASLTALEQAGHSRQHEYDSARAAVAWSEVHGDPIIEE